ncbi:multidrug and toxin extrusion protein 1-like isoform X2 [Myripristis murdjan]|nr:multidrug and toxin extrusion protein 1-like isoform X2 [Myripristis murdjan]
MDGSVTPPAPTNTLNGHSKTEEAPVTQDTSGGCGACLRRIQGLIRADYRNEIAYIIKIAGPVVISQLMIYMISFTSTVFCGHMGKTELSGVALATAVINVTGISIGMGLASACDTLISQTYGSGNLKRVGVILQRGILILLLACFPCWAVLINTEPILLAVRQSPEVASLSQLYVMIFMPALPAAFMYQLQARYLQNQEVIWPQVITGALGNVLNAVINYIFVFHLDLGVAGSAAANAISQYSLSLILFTYISWKGLYKATWGGWSLDCLQEWGPFIKVAVPSMLMLCLEWWMFELGGFLAGLIGEVELGAQSVVYGLATIAYMFPLGFAVAASVRVGNALGSGNTEQAKLSGKVSVICAITMSCFVGASLGIPKDVIGYIFTTEPEIIQRVADVMILYGFFHIADATAGVMGGVIRGAGKQMMGALGNMVGYYFIGFPIGVSLMFAANMGILGLWSGFIICVSLQSIFFLVFLCKLNWKKATEEALQRAGVQSTQQNEMVGMENSAFDTTDDTDRSKTRVRTRPVPSSCVGSEDSNVNMEVLGSGQAASTTVGVILSVRQLVLRRGLSVVIMVLILVAGIFISDLLSKLLK